MKKRTASILVAAACTASMLVGVTAAGVIKEIKATDGTILSYDADID